MSAFTEATLPKPIKRGTLERSWQKTVKECNKLLQRLSEHQLSKIGGWLPQKLANGSHKGRISALVTVYRHEFNEVRVLALETESFRRLYRREQDLLRTKLTAKVPVKEQRKMEDLLRQVHCSEIQAENKLERNRRSTSSHRRRRQAKKAERQAADRARTMQMKGAKTHKPLESTA